MVVLLDSAAIAAFLDRDDEFHPAAEARVRDLAGRAGFIASVISYAGLLTGAGLGHHDASAVRGFFADLVDEVYPVDVPIAERAAELRSARCSLKMPDALILATADLQGADAIVTADHGWADALPGTRVELLGDAPV